MVVKMVTLAETKGFQFPTKPRLIKSTMIIIHTYNVNSMDYNLIQSSRPEH